MSERFASALRRLEQAEYVPDEFGRPFVELFPVTGAAISTIGDPLGNETIAATDPRAARLDEAQFDLGEGPCWDAVRTGTVIGEAALADAGRQRWPAFARAASEHRVTSIYAFPMSVGSLRLGAVDLYSVDPMTLDQRQSRQAAALAMIVGQRILRHALHASGAEEDEPGPRSRRIIHQATGMVLAQLETTPEDAELMLQGQAFASGRSMMDVAADIVQGRLRFHRVADRIEVR